MAIFEVTYLVKKKREIAARDLAEIAERVKTFADGKKEGEVTVLSIIRTTPAPDSECADCEARKKKLEVTTREPTPDPPAPPAPACA